jgi:holo-[acyl-carrier protein] synthase
MIDSVGIDIVEVHRIKKAIDRWGDSFIHRIFTPWEINYCGNKQFPEQSFAARFAAKEAVLKAIGTGYIRGIKWTSIEVVNNNMGQPTIRIGEHIKKIVGAKTIIVSMSHTHEHAVASAILCKGGKE